MLAQLEKDMDNGKVKFVLNKDQRWAFSDDIFEELNLESGQTISDSLLLEVMKYNRDKLAAKIYADRIVKDNT